MPNLVVRNEGLLLNGKARHAILEALRFQLAAWQAQTEDELGEDAFADLQNDILYLQGLLGSLEEDFAA